MSNLSRRIERLEDALERSGASLCPAGYEGTVIGLVHPDGKTVARLEGEERSFPTEDAFREAFKGFDLVTVHFVGPEEVQA